MQEATSEIEANPFYFENSIHIFSAQTKIGPPRQLSNEMSEMSTGTSTSVVTATLVKNTTITRQLDTIISIQYAVISYKLSHRGILKYFRFKDGIIMSKNRRATKDGILTTLTARAIR